jgi:hypothetical protein
MLKECPKSYQAFTSEMNLRKGKSVHCKQKIEKYKEVINSKDKKNEKKQIAPKQNS